MSLFEALSKIDQVNIGQKQKNTIKKFANEISTFSKQVDTFSMVEMVNNVIERFNIQNHYDKQNTAESKERWQNIEELVNGIVEYQSDKKDANLVEFLEEVSLLTDIDKWNDEVKQVTLMTIHSSKGLEFPIVIISGLEEGLFPISQYLEQNDELEEERRLFYVGATRAMEKLYLSYSKFRRRFGAENVDKFLPKLIRGIKFKIRPGNFSRGSFYSPGRTCHHSSLSRRCCKDPKLWV